MPAMPTYLVSVPIKFACALYKILAPTDTPFRPLDANNVLADGGSRYWDRGRVPSVDAPDLQEGIARRRIVEAPGSKLILEPFQ